MEWYISVTALTGGVERSLGRLVKTLEAHQGPLSEDASLIQALLHVDMDGPKHERDIANHGADTDSTATVVSTVSDVLGGNVSRGLRLTPFSRRCATLWVREHGRRFGVYKNGHAMAKRPQAENTDAAAARRQECAFRSLEHFAESVVGQDSDCLTVLGMSGKTVQARVRKLEGGSVVGHRVKLSKLREFSRKKCQLVTDEKSHRRAVGDAYLVPDLRLGTLFRNAPKQCQRTSTRAVLNATGVSVAWKAGWAVHDSTGVSVVTSPRAMLGSCFQRQPGDREGYL